MKEHSGFMKVHYHNKGIEMIGLFQAHAHSGLAVAVSRRKCAVPCCSSSTSISRRQHRPDVSGNAAYQFDEHTTPSTICRRNAIGNSRAKTGVCNPPTWWASWNWHAPTVVDY